MAASTKNEIWEKGVNRLCKCYALRGKTKKEKS